MLGLIKTFLTTETAQWYETLPFVVGIVFVVIELVMRIVKSIKPIFSAAAFGYVLSEGITVCVIPIYGIALAFDRTLATAIADKNAKVLVVAMFVAFATLAIHISDRWFASERP
jgi:hypothetical protein